MILLRFFLLLNEKLYLLFCFFRTRRTRTTIAPTRNGKTNVPNRYSNEADPAAPVPTIPAKSEVKTNSVEPIPAGDGMTAASMTESEVIASTSCNAIPESDPKIKNGIEYQNASFSRFNPIVSTISSLFFSRCFDASSIIWH